MTHMEKKEWFGMELCKIGTKFKKISSFSRMIRLNKKLVVYNYLLQN